MSLKRIFSRLISFVLIAAGLYQVFYSSWLILFIYPKLSIGQNASDLLIQEGLIEKALVYWLTIVVGGLYGFFLLFKPEEEVGIYHLVAGVLISIFSIFFIINTPLTPNLIFHFLEKYFK